MQKIKCPKCKKETFEAKYCMYCHAELHLQTESDDDDKKRLADNKC